MINPSLWMSLAKWGAIALTVVSFLFALRRSGEKAGRLAERLTTQEKSNAIRRAMLEATARRPHDRDELARRLLDGGF